MRRIAKSDIGDGDYYDDVNDEQNDGDDGNDVFVFVFPSLFCQLTKSDELLTKLRYLKSLVAPLVESYWVSACALRWLSNQTFSGKVHKRKLRSKDSN